MNDNNYLLKNSTVYAYHVPNINAIKVGFGVNGKQRFASYSRQYSLSSVSKSLREWTLPATSIASAVETACHKALIQSGFDRLNYVIDEKEAKELFELGPHAYEDAVLVVAEAIQETINSLYEALGKQKPGTDEKARRLKEDAQKRREILKKDREILKIQEQERQIILAMNDLELSWNDRVQPFVDASEKTSLLMAQFNNQMSSQINSKGIIKYFFEKKAISNVTQIKTWDNWPLVKKMFYEIFATARNAKEYLWELDIKYSGLARNAAKRLGLNLNSPQGIALPFIYERPISSPLATDHNGSAFTEVLMVVSTATGFQVGDAIELIKSDPELMSLVALAAKKKPPEYEICFIGLEDKYIIAQQPALSKLKYPIAGRAEHNEVERVVARIKTCEQAIRINPDDDEAWVNLGLAYKNSGQFAEALEAYQQAVRIKPNHKYAFFCLGIGNANTNQTAKIIDAYQNAIHINPDDSHLWYYLGLTYAKSNQLAKAIDAYRQAIHIKPYYAREWFDLGIAYYGLNDFARAIEAYQQAIHLTPEHTLAWNNLGNCYLCTKEYDKAIDAYQQAIRIKPDDTKAWYNLGYSYKILDQTVKVTEVYKRLKTIDPNLADSFFNKFVNPQGKI